MVLAQTGRWAEILISYIQHYNSLKILLLVYCFDSCCIARNYHYYDNDLSVMCLN